MRTGTYEHEITIERLIEGRSGPLNEPTSVWTPLRTVNCRAESRRGREFFDNNARHSETVFDFYCHFDDVVDVTPIDRIVFGETAFNIKMILPDLVRRNEIVISASQV